MFFGGAKLGVGGDGGAGMAGHADFRDDGDVARGGVGDDVFDFLLGVEAAVGFAGAFRAVPTADLGIGTFAADGGELGIFFDLDAPALIICEMPMKDVHFERGHLVEQLSHFLSAFEIPGFVQLEGTPCKAWLVGDGGAENVPSSICFFRGNDFCGKKLKQALDAVEHACGAGGFDHGIFLDDLQGVAFAAEFFQRGIKCEHDLLALGLVLTDHEFHAGGWGDQVAQRGGFIGERVRGDDRSIRSDGEFPIFHFRLGGKWNDGASGSG